MWIKPSAYIVRGKPAILAFWDFFAKEQHIDEVNRLRKANLQFKQYFDHMKMVKIAEWIHDVAGLNFDKLNAPRAFKEINEEHKAELERIEERKRKEMKKGRPQPKRDDGGKWPHA